MSRLSRTAVRHLIALGLYTVAAAILTWPLLPHITTHVPGDGIDDPALVWNLWWVKFRLVDQLSVELFNGDWMFHPININLGFYTLTPLNGLLSVPLQTATSLIIANNIFLLLSFIIGGYGLFLLALEIQSLPPFAHDVSNNDYTQSQLFSPTVMAALFAGLFYAFASAKLFYAALGQFNIASSQWIPFAVLFVVRLMRSATARQAVVAGFMAGFFMVLQAWAELTYASFLLIFFALTFVWWAVARISDAYRRGTSVTAPAGVNNYSTGVVVAAVVFVVGVSPFLIAMLPDLRTQVDLFSSGGGFADVFSADIMGYLVPTRLHPIFGGFAATLPFPNDKGQQIYLGYIFLLLAFFGVYGYGIRKRAHGVRSPTWFWVMMTAAFWLLTLGPTLRWAGQSTGIPGPFALVSQLPFFGGNRYPSRYSVMLLMSAASLSVFGLRYLADRVYQLRYNSLKPARAALVLFSVLSALLLFEHLSVPLPMSDFRTPSVYQTLANESGDFAVLELPTGWRNGARVLGRSDVLIMMQQWYQTTHGKRRLGGNTSRNPQYKFQYFTDAPLIGDLIALMNADREHIAPVIEKQYDALVERDHSLAPDVLDFLGIDYVLVHVEKSPEALLRFVEDVLPVTLVETWQGDDWSGTPSTIRLYRVDPVESAAAWELDLSQPQGRLHLAEGWSSLDSDDADFRYATAPESTLLLDLPDAGGTLTLQLARATEAVGYRLNEHPLSAEVDADTNRVVLHVPAGATAKLVDRLTIEWPDTPQPVSALSDTVSASIGETGYALDPGTWIGIRSAGEEVGDFAAIYVNGVNQAVNERGYNLVALQPDGEVMDSQVFDTHGSESASSEMAGWIESWPSGTIVAGAVADEASNHLNEEAMNVLRSLGVAQDLRGRFRWGHAFVGVVGAAPGTALEDSQLIQVSDVSIGPPVDSTAYYGAVSTIQFEQAGQ